MWLFRLVATWANIVRNNQHSSVVFCFELIDSAVKFSFLYLLLDMFEQFFFHSKKSPTGPTERTPKPEYQKTLDRNLLKGVRWESVPFNF